MNDGVSATPQIAVPWHYWAIAVISLVWNAYGGVDYTLTRLRNMDFLTAVAGSHEKAEQMLASIDAMPVIAQIGWGLGVWGSVLGSVLLLVRSRHAVAAFLASLAGAAVSFGYQLSSMPGEMNTPAGLVMVAVIVGAVVFFWWYARRAAARGILR